MLSLTQKLWKSGFFCLFVLWPAQFFLIVTQPYGCSVSTVKVCTSPHICQPHNITTTAYKICEHKGDNLCLAHNIDNAGYLTAQIEQSVKLTTVYFEFLWQVI